MSRRSKNRRRRERKRRKHQLRKRALQLPPVRKISTAALFEEIERRRLALAEIFSGTDQT
jgi:hypothetical protein